MEEVEHAEALVQPWDEWADDHRFSIQTTTEFLLALEERLLLYKSIADSLVYLFTWESPTLSALCVVVLMLLIFKLALGVMLLVLLVSFLWLAAETRQLLEIQNKASQRPRQEKRAKVIEAYQSCEKEVRDEHRDLVLKFQRVVAQYVGLWQKMESVVKLNKVGLLAACAALCVLSLIFPFLVRLTLLGILVTAKIWWKKVFDFRVVVARRRRSSERIVARVPPPSDQDEIFSDMDFKTALEEANKAWELRGKPSPEDIAAGWVTMMDSPDIQVVRRQYGDADIEVQYEYRTLAKISDLDPMSAAHSIYDMSFRKQWDANMSSWKVVDEKTCCVYYEIKYPFPMSNRDYVYHRQLREFQESNQVVILAKNSRYFTTKVPSPSSWNIRVHNFNQIVVLKMDRDKSSCLLYMRYLDSPGGWIPTAVVNAVISNTIPAFLKNWKNASWMYSMKSKKES